ncbi:MAG: rcc01693 family protein [Pseudomonadota bacterium]
MSVFDWPALCRLGMGQMRLKPSEFWALTPAELRLMAGPQGAQPLQRSKLEALMRRFPDATQAGKEPSDG